MTQLLNNARRLFSREEGATMVEYGLMVALIAVVCVAGVTLIGGNLSAMFNTMSANF
ncbi:MAG: Flp family type IVb pilin [Planctomycetaceae bacterium]